MWKPIYALSILVLASVSMFAQNRSLRGDDAIKELKQTGQYDSLVKAVSAVRKDSGQTDEPPIEDAVGQTTKLSVSDGATGDRFGNSLAVSGETVIVGAYNDDVGMNSDQGSAYVFVKTGAVWTQQAQLIAGNGAAFDQFGISVSISGDTAIVGSFGDDIGANFDQGSAYVFVRSGGVWTEQAQLNGTGGAANDYFGYRVSISDETAVVGAYQDDVDANVDQGSAYVFVRSGGVWTQQAQLNGSDSEGADLFGISVAISGDTIVVGAHQDDVAANVNQGSAYVFVRSGTLWTQEAQLTATGGSPFDEFGISVVISGDTAIIGAHLDNVGGNANQGSASVFVRSSTIWTQQAQLTETNGEPNDNFGYGVSISGETVIVGAWRDDGGGTADQGSASVFTRSGSVWIESAPLYTHDAAPQDFFGASVAISGNNVIVGAFNDDVGTNFDQGSVYIFRLLGNGWTQEAKKAAPGAMGDFFGFSVAISGDTAIVGASSFNVIPVFDQGAAFVFVRSGSGWTQQAQLTAAAGATADQFGISVAISGDTAIVGANFDDVGSNFEQGSAYVFVRNGTVWTQQAQLNATSGAQSDEFGISVAISGDTAIVGAWEDNVGTSISQGSAYIFVRSGTVWTQQAQLNAGDGSGTDYFGFSVAIFGETALIGAFSNRVGPNLAQGSAYVFVRSGTVWTQQAQLNAADGTSDDQFGISVAISGNTAIIGAHFDDVGGINLSGSAYIFVRSGTAWTQQVKLTAPSNEEFNIFGNRVAISGDTAIVGSSGADVAYVFVKSGTLWPQQAQLTALDASTDGDRFGASVAISGDRIIIGAWQADASQTAPLAPQGNSEGAAYMFVNNLAPSAANVSISGRVTTANGNGIRNAIVQLTGTDGVTRRAVTSSFGYYRFYDVEVGRTYNVGVTSKRYTFEPRIITLADEIGDLDLVAMNE